MQEVVRIILIIFGLYMYREDIQFYIKDKFIEPAKHRNIQKRLTRVPPELIDKFKLAKEEHETDKLHDLYHEIFKYYPKKQLNINKYSELTLDCIKHTLTKIGLSLTQEQENRILETMKRQKIYRIDYVSDTIRGTACGKYNPKHQEIYLFDGPDKDTIVHELIHSIVNYPSRTTPYGDIEEGLASLFPAGKWGWEWSKFGKDVEFEPYNFLYAPVAFLLLKLKGSEILFNEQLVSETLSDPSEDNSLAEIAEVKQTTVTVTASEKVYRWLRILRRKSSSVREYLKEYKTFILRRDRVSAFLVSNSELRRLFPEWYE